MTTRALLVYDGDNLHASLKSFQPKYNKRLRLRSLDRMIMTLLPDDCLARSVMFVSRKPDPAQPEAWNFKNRHTGIIIRTHPIVDGFGYPDVALERYIDEHLGQFDRLVIVSSDSDFFPYAERMARDHGKDVAIFAIRRNTNVPALNRLSGVKACFIDDFVELNKPAMQWDSLVKLLPSRGRW